MADLSPAVDLAWQAAADEALQARTRSIGPEHLLAGVCSVEKLITVQASQSDGELSQLLQKAQEECTPLNEALSSCHCDPAALRRELRKRFSPDELPASQTPIVKRSQASHEAFARAQRISLEASLPTIGLSALVLALLDSSNSHIAASFTELRIDTAEIIVRLRSLLASLSPKETLVNEVVASFSTSSAAYSLPLRNNDSARLALLYELPLQFGKGMPIDQLFRNAVGRISQVIPGATHSAFLLRDRKTGALLLQAHVPSGGPAISITLAQHAMERCEGLLWLRGESDSTASLDSHGLHSCIYAPLVRDDEPLGVLCIGSKDQNRPLDAEDLRLVVAVAQHAAMAFSNWLFQNDLLEKNNLLERLLTNFSPRVRDTLLAKAARGRLRLGGERSEVTILFSDIRGFTRMSAGLSADEVVDLLNDYFSVLVDAIFRHDGTIDKFVGDAILAVFGSPEPDPGQHEKAARTALAMQTAMRERSDSRRARGLPTCEIGIGLHCGEVLHGFIGSAERMEFTVIGDAVNRAARYCAGAAGNEILLSPSVHQCVWHSVDVEATVITTKHEGELPAFRLLRLR